MRHRRTEQVTAVWNLNPESILCAALWLRDDEFLTQKQNPIPPLVMVRILIDR